MDVLRYIKHPLFLILIFFFCEVINKFSFFELNADDSDITDFLGICEYHFNQCYPCFNVFLNFPNVLTSCSLAFAEVIDRK